MENETPSDNLPPDIYPVGSVRALMQTELVTPQTRQALAARLSPIRETPRFLEADAFATLEAVCARLMPATPLPSPHDLSCMVDYRLAKGDGDGWRYAALPPDGQAYALALNAINARAQALHQTSFAQLHSAQQDAILVAVQTGSIAETAANVPQGREDSTASETWQRVPPKRFFEELLAELTQYYYSHPLAQEDIGYAGMADGRGWQKIGLNEREAWETAPGSVFPSPQELPADLPNRKPYEEAAYLGALPKGEGAASSAPTGNLTDADVVVVGTGAGGAPLLARLARAGLRVVALEAGRDWNPPKDFATDELAQTPLYWQDERLSDGGDPLNFGSNNSGIGVGGSTLHYTAYVPRPHRDDFRLHTDFGVGADWPISYDDLRPYYEEVEQFLGVSGPSPYLWDPERSPYPLEPLPLNAAALLMQRACKTLGIRTSPAPNAALSQPYAREGVGLRPACSNRGFCQAGCSIRAKGSMDVTYIAAARNWGAEVRPNCFVTRIERDARGRVTGVIYVRDGREERQTCRALFLCAGAIETPRLLLLNDLGLDSGQVGQNFMAHTGMQIWAQFDEMTRPYKGIPGGLISEDTHRPPDADFAGGYLLQSLGVMPVTYATQLARSQQTWGEALRRHMRGYNHVAGINILGECLPSESNRVELSDEYDSRGMPKPRIHFTAGENEKRLHAHAERLMRAIWSEAGGKDIWAYTRFAHIMGTCRMGHDPATSVINARCRVHQVPNLYIMDNSVFASALAVNPALTIMALSLRAADLFLADKSGSG